MAERIALRELALELRTLEPHELDAVLEACDDAEVETLDRTWQTHAHSYQLRPEGARIWYLNGGRGSGKTRGVAEHRCDRGEDHGPALIGLLAGKTIADVRDVMIEGESGLIACGERRGYKIDYIANKSLVRHPSGARWHIVTSEKPDKPRGYQSNDVWGDEPSSWQHAIPFFDNIMFGHRLGGAPLHADFSSTPKPNPITRRLLRDPKWLDRVTVTSGTSYQNLANLATDFAGLLDAIYKGTTLGDQELLGILLDGLGAVVDADTIDRFRVGTPGEIMRRVVSLDPAATSKVTSDDSGIVVVGADGQPYPHAYLLGDLTLRAAPPQLVCETVVEAFIAYDCDSIVVETNNGGEWITTALREAIEAAGLDPDAVPIVPVFAKVSKRTRFEPVGALYQRGRIHHVGHYPELEKEATEWIPGEDSPNRLDAHAQAVSHLLLGDRQVGDLSGYL